MRTPKPNREENSLPLRSSTRSISATGTEKRRTGHTMSSELWESSKQVGRMYSQIPT